MWGTLPGVLETQRSSCNSGLFYSGGGEKRLIEGWSRSFGEEARRCSCLVIRVFPGLRCTWARGMSKHGLQQRFGDVEKGVHAAISVFFFLYLTTLYSQERTANFYMIAMC